MRSGFRSSRWRGRRQRHRCRNRLRRRARQTDPRLPRRFSAFRRQRGLDREPAGRILHPRERREDHLVSPRLLQRLVADTKKAEDALETARCTVTARSSICPRFSETTMSAAAKPESSPEVLYSVKAHTATITLNRPERMNTISRAMLAELCEALLKAENDKKVRVVILTGTGRAFCAGLDLTEVTRSSGGIADGASQAVTLNLRDTPPTILFAMDKPTICAL